MFSLLLCQLGDRWTKNQPKLAYGKIGNALVYVMEKSRSSRSWHQVRLSRASWEVPETQFLYFIAGSFLRHNLPFSSQGGRPGFSLSLFSVSGRRRWWLSCWASQRLVIESGCLWLAQLVSSAFLNQNCMDGMGWIDHLGDSWDCWESGVSLQWLLGLPSSSSCPSRAGRVLVIEEMAGGKTLHDKLENQSFCLSSIFAGFLQTFSYSLLW